MAEKIKGIEIAISADTTGVTKGLKEITSESMKTSKNLKTVESLLKLDPHNTELVAQKQKLLAENIEQTKDKLNKLKAAQDDVKKAFERGEISEEQYIAFQGEIVKTENRLKQLEGQCDDTSGAIKETGKEADESGSKLKNGLAEGAKAAGIAIAAVGTAVAAGAKALTDFTISGASYADEILTDSQVTGIATDKLQEYRYAAELVDVSTDTLTKSMAKNIKSMSSAAKGTGDTAAAYKKLGVSVKNSDGSLRDSQEVYWELIDALGKVDNETERDAMAMQILGKSAQELNPLIAAGSARMEELGKQARDAGAVLSQESLESFGELDDQLQLLKANSMAAKNALGTALLPMLKTLSTKGNNLITKFTKKLKAANGDVEKMADAVGEMIPELIDNIVKNLPKILSVAARIVKSLANGIIQQLPMIIETGLKLIADLALGIAQALPELVPTIVDVILKIVDTLIDNIDLLVDAALQLIQGLADGLIKALPVLIEKAPKIITKLIDGLVENFPKLINAGIEMVPKIVEGIIQNLPALAQGAWEIVWGIINGIIELFGDLISIGQRIGDEIGKGLYDKVQEAYQWGKDLMEGFISGMKSKWDKLKEEVESVAILIKAFLHFSKPDVGPLREYEKWMPDLMKGLASGIEKNKYLVADAVRGLSEDMVLSPTANITAAGAGSTGGLSQVININMNANIASDMDIRIVAERLGQELQTLTAQNNAMQGAW